VTAGPIGDADPEDGQAALTPIPSEPVTPYAVVLSRQARRNIHEDLPLEVAVAAMETITGSIAAHPHRVGKPLEEPFDGYHSARRGTYRIIYRINEDKHAAEVYSIRHRRDAYRT
jgi:mRNA interferase RelE/StbE